MRMPEAAMEPNDLPSSTENHIRRPGKLSTVNSEPVDERMQKGAEINLRLGVFALVRCHRFPDGRRYIRPGARS